MSVRTACGFVNGCAQQGGLSKEEASELELAVDEICTNIVMHGYRGEEGRVDLSVDCSSDAVRVTVADTAGPFDPMAFNPPDPRVPLSKREVGRMGLLIARHMVDDISYEREGERNKLTMTKLVRNGSMLKADRGRE